MNLFNHIILPSLAGICISVPLGISMKLEPFLTVMLSMGIIIVLELFLK